MLALVAYTLKPVKLLDPCKRTQHCWPTTRNIVGPNMLRPFEWNHNNVGTCCVKFEISQTFRPMQTDATLLAKNPSTTRNNVVTCCVRLHGPIRYVPKCIAIHLLHKTKCEIALLSLMTDPVPNHFLLSLLTLTIMTLITITIMIIVLASYSKITSASSPAGYSKI